jgi:hypothetical protein
MGRRTELLKCRRSIAMRSTSASMSANMMTAKHWLSSLSLGLPVHRSENLLLKNNSSLLNSGTTWHSYSGRDPSNMTWNLPTSGTCEDEIEQIEI